MFNPDFYPTKKETFLQMVSGFDLKNKVVFEPSAGKGNIINFSLEQGAKEVIFCEIEPDLVEICQKNAKLLKNNFLQVKSSEISHVDFIIMNPPFSKDVEHILHAFEVAPHGSEIITLCNAQTVENPFNKKRQELETLILNFGDYENIGACFTDAERKTGVEVGLIRFKKPADEYETEFTGFFMEEEEEQNESGLLQYNFIRDLVGRYIMAVKVYDKQAFLHEDMKKQCGGFFSPDLGFSAKDSKGNFVDRESFKKSLQRDGWSYIFKKMNLTKFATTGLREDINKFIEDQKDVPFTMKNIFVMLDTVLATTGQRMDKAMLEMFDTLTKHTHENRYNVEGWKTNSHYMLNEKFILGYLVEPDYSDSSIIDPQIGGNFNKVEDFLKSLCYLTGDNYDDFESLYNTLNARYIAYYEEDGKKIIVDTNRHEFPYYKMESFGRSYPDKKIKIEPVKMVFGKWFEWAYFDIKCFKKGTIHFKFRDRELWGRYNQKIAELKGYPLFESNEETRKKNAKKEAQNRPKKTVTQDFEILTTIKI